MPSQKGFAKFNQAGTGKKGQTEKYLKAQRTVRTKGGGASPTALGGANKKFKGRKGH
jgi:hypothetical protein